MFSDIAYILLFYSTAVYDYQQQFMKHSGNLKALMCSIFFNESINNKDLLAEERFLYVKKNFIIFNFVIVP